MSIISILFPIKREESVKFFSVAALMSSIVFVYSTVRTLKDGIVVRLLSAESLSFLKLAIVLPFSVIVVFLYNLLHKFMNRINVPYIFLFGMGFALSSLSFFIFSNENISAKLMLMLKEPNFVKDFLPLHKFTTQMLAVFSKWYVALFYAISELFGTMCLNAICWRLANEVFAMGQSRRLYSYLTMFGNLGMMFGGGFLSYVARRFQADDSTFFMVIGVGTLVATMSAVLSYFVSVKVSGITPTKPQASTKTTAATAKKSKPGFFESFKLVFSNDILLYIFLITIGYMVSINLVEITWKKVVGIKTGKALVGKATVASYCKVAGGVSLLTGLTTILSAFAGSFIIKRFGWFTTAIIPPIICGVGGLAFLYVFYIENLMGWGSDVSLVLGTIQNISTKACKYTMVDLAREMAYKILFEREAAKNIDPSASNFGKANVEVIGGKLGKQLGAFIQIILLTSGSSVVMCQEEIAIKIAVIMTFFVVLWLWAVFKLNAAIRDEYNAKVEEKSN